MFLKLKSKAEETKDAGVVFDEEAYEKSYRRYKYRCYGYLVLKALLAFVAGVFLAYLLRLLG